jgi:hypothetical protein
MRESYFSGLDWGNPKSLEILPEDLEKVRTIFTDIGVETVDDLLSSQERVRFQPALVEFYATLQKMQDETGQPFPRRALNIDIITPQQMSRHLSPQRDAMLQKYGRFVSGSIAGCTEENQYGGYDIKIAAVGQNFSKADFLSVLGHEYGHTIPNKERVSAVLEEVKAEAFAGLVLSENYGFSVNVGELDFRNPHQLARYMLEVLDSGGIPREAVISHITNDTFMGFPPDAYKYYLE